jgi:hypothetical protein
VDEDARRELQLLMGVQIPTPDGHSAVGLSLNAADAARFFLGPPVDLPPRDVSETMERITAGFTAEGFTLTGKSPPGAPSPRQWTQRPAVSGILVGERDVTNDMAYDRVTRWVSGSLVLVWIAIAVAGLALRQGWWIEAAFLGALVLAIPAFILSSYRGRGYSELVLVAELTSLSPPGETADGSALQIPLRIRVGGARVTSRQPIGRNLNGRWVRTVESSPVAAASTSAIYHRLSS